MKVRKKILRVALSWFIFSLFLCVNTHAADLNEEFWDAARKGDVKKVSDLIDKGVNINAKTRYGATALSFAADKGHVEVVKLLLGKGADVNTTDSFYGATPITWAVSNNHVEIVGLLLDKGATGVEDALIMAVENKNVELIKILLAKAKFTPKSLSEALAVAEEVKDAGVIDLLKKAGAQQLPAEKAVQVQQETLKSYEGAYSTEGNELRVEAKDGELYLHLSSQHPIKMVAVDQSTFKSEDLSGFTIIFQSENGTVTGFKVTRADGSSSIYTKVKTESATSTKQEGKTQTQVAKPAVPSKKNWPSFRGWNASGIADGQNPPVTWNAEKSENILWKTPIPGLAHSSPIVWDNRVFVTTAIISDPNVSVRHGLYGDVTPDKDVSKHTWRIYCLDRQTGKILWDQTAVEGTPEVKRHPKSSQANSTPVTDGKHVVVLFNSGDLLCYDVEGKLLWKQDLGTLDSGWFYDPEYQWGYGSSPILYKNLVIVQCDRQKDSFIAAFDVAKGKRVWLTRREEIPSWGTPTLYEGKSRAELITNGTNAIRGYDPMTGKELWKLSGNAEITVPTPIYSEDLIYVTSGYAPIQPIYAVRPGARGDITLAKDTESNEFVVWSKKRGGPYMPTPIVYGDYLYTCANNGVVTCYNARTGERIYQQRLGGKGSAYAFTASPVAAEGNLYFTSEDGEIFVVKAGPVFELVSTNPIGEVCLATPAIANGMFIVRAQNHVYGIGEKPSR